MFLVCVRWTVMCCSLLCIMQRGDIQLSLCTTFIPLPSLAITRTHWIIHRNLGFNPSRAKEPHWDMLSRVSSPLCWGLSSSLITNAGPDRLPAALDTLHCIQTPRATCLTSLSGHILSVFTTLEGIYNA